MEGKVFLVKPEVAGNIADSDFIERSARPPLIRRLRYQFDGWSGDDLITSIATFIVTQRLRKAIESEGMTGVSFADVETFTSDQFKELYGEKQLPKFYWMQITGELGKDDFSMSPKHRLAVSSSALDLLKQFKIANADIQPYSS
jgi:hypothetical protein